MMSRNHRKRLIGPGGLAAVVLIAFMAMAGRGDEWPHWRGPFFNGASGETNLPAQWSKTENVAWTVELPGPSAATPVVWGERVFLPSTDTAARTLRALAVDRPTGKVLWSHKIADGMQRGRESNYASPSATTDGQRVVFFYGNGDLAAFDFAGNKLWSRNLQSDYGDFAFNFTFSSSPTLHQEKLYMQVLQRDEPVHGRGRTDGPIESFLLAIEPASGKTLWRAVRPSEAEAESREAYSTPIPFEHNGRGELLITGGDCISGHNLDSGRELWRWGTWNPSRIGHWRLVPSPVSGAGVVLACAPKGGAVYALKAGQSGKLDDSAIAWQTDRQREVTSDVPTPLFYLGDFFVLSDLRRTLARVDPRTGAVKWQSETPGRSKYEASPTGADGRLYIMNFAGEVAVFEAETGKLVQVAAMGEPGDTTTRSSIAVAHGQLFIRTNCRLYCVGKK